MGTNKENIYDSIAISDPDMAALECANYYIDRKYSVL